MNTKSIQNEHLIHEYLTVFKRSEELNVKKKEVAIKLERNDVNKAQKKIAWIFFLPAFFYAFSLFFVTGDPISAFSLSYRGESVDHISMLSVFFSIFTTLGYIFYIFEKLEYEMNNKYSIHSFSYFKGVVFNWFSHITLFLTAFCSLKNDIEFSNIVTPLFWYLIFGHGFIMFLIHTYFNDTPDDKVNEISYERFDAITIDIEKTKQYELLLQHKILENEALMTLIVGKSKHLSFKYEENYIAYQKLLNALEHKSKNLKSNNEYVDKLKTSLNNVYSKNKHHHKSLIENN